MDNLIFESWAKKKNTVANIYSTEGTVDEACSEWRNQVLQAAAKKTLDCLIEECPPESRVFLNYEAIGELSCFAETQPSVRLLAFGVTGTIKDILMIGQEIQPVLGEDYSCLAIFPYYTAASLSPEAVGDLAEGYLDAVQNNLDPERLSQIRQALSSYSVFAQLDHLKEDVLSSVSTGVVLIGAGATDSSRDQESSQWAKQTFPQTLCTPTMIFHDGVLHSLIQEIYFLLGDDARRKNNLSSVGLINRMDVVRGRTISFHSYIDDVLFGECELPAETGLWALGMVSCVLQERGISMNFS